MPTNTPPEPKTMQPEPREEPAQPHGSPARRDNGADQEAKPPEHEKRIERFRER